MWRLRFVRPLLSLTQCGMSPSSKRSCTRSSYSWVTSPLLIQTVGLHELSHALAGVLTCAKIESITVGMDSMLTPARPRRGRCDAHARWYPCTHSTGGIPWFELHRGSVYCLRAWYWEIAYAGVRYQCVQGRVSRAGVLLPHHAVLGAQVDRRVPHDLSYGRPHPGGLGRTADVDMLAGSWIRRAPVPRPLYRRHVVFVCDCEFYLMLITVGYCRRHTQAQDQLVRCVGVRQAHGVRELQAVG